MKQAEKIGCGPALNMTTRLKNRNGSEDCFTDCFWPTPYYVGHPMLFLVRICVLSDAPYFMITSPQPSRRRGRELSCLQTRRNATEHMPI